MVAALGANIWLSYDSHSEQERLRENVNMTNSKLDTLGDLADAQRKQIDSLSFLMVRVDSVAREMFPQLPPPAAIDSLGSLLSRIMASQVRAAEDRIVDVINRPRFRPLSQERHLALSLRCRQFLQAYGSQLKGIELKCEEGNRERENFVAYLFGILDSVGLPVRLSRQSTWGRPTNGPLLIEFHSGETDLMLALANALNVVFVAQCDTIARRSIGKGEIALTFLGDPLFGQDGLVHFR